MFSIVAARGQSLAIHKSKEAEPDPHLLGLPVELIVHILSFLPTESVGICASLCKTWKACTKSFISQKEKSFFENLKELKNIKPKSINLYPVNDRVASICFPRSTKEFILGGDSLGKIFIIQKAMQKSVLVSGHRTAIKTLQVNDQWMATAGHTIKLWDLSKAWNLFENNKEPQDFSSTKTLNEEFGSLKNWIRSLDLKGERLLSSDSNNAVKLWNIDQGSFTTYSPGRPVLTVQFTSENSFLTTHRDLSLTFWDSRIEKSTSTMALSKKITSAAKLEAANVYVSGNIVAFYRFDLTIFDIRNGGKLLLDQTKLNGMRSFSSLGNILAYSQYQCDREGKCKGSLSFLRLKKDLSDEIISYDHHKIECNQLNDHLIFDKETLATASSLGAFQIYDLKSLKK